MLIGKIEKSTILDLVDKGLARAESFGNNIANWRNATLPYRIHNNEILIHPSAFTIRIGYSAFSRSSTRQNDDDEKCVEKARKFLFTRLVSKPGSYQFAIFMDKVL